ncbi:hypothetical protein R5R35_011638 [Gryllus longicercus]|uniref:Uncharacterized protein n=1 Tax=Gryllus longicercus TaxID=2509291 RepID=A0AAN9VPP7_9ORTH
MSGFPGRGRSRHWNHHGGNSNPPWSYTLFPPNQNAHPHPPNSWHAPRWDKRPQWRFQNPSNNYRPQGYGRNQFDWKQDFNHPPPSSSFNSLLNQNHSSNSSHDHSDSKSGTKHSDSRTRRDFALDIFSDEDLSDVHCDEDSGKGKHKSHFSHNLCDSKHKESDSRNRDSDFKYQGFRLKESEGFCKRIAESGPKLQYNKHGSHSGRGESHVTSTGKCDSQYSTSSKRLSLLPAPVNPVKKIDCLSSSNPQTKTELRNSNSHGKGKTKTKITAQTKLSVKIVQKGKQQKGKGVSPKTSQKNVPKAPPSPNLEEVRQVEITKAAEKLKRYLQEKHEGQEKVLENLLNKTEGQKSELKAPGPPVDKSRFDPELHLTPTDLQDIGKIKTDVRSSSLCQTHLSSQEDVSTPLSGTAENPRQSESNNFAASTPKRVTPVSSSKFVDSSSDIIVLHSPEQTVQNSEPSILTELHELSVITPSAGSINATSVDVSDSSTKQVESKASKSSVKETKSDRTIHLSKNGSNASNSVSSHQETKSPVRQILKSTVQSESKSASNQDSKSPAHRRESKSPAHRHESKSPAHRRESASPAPLQESKTPSHRSESKSPAHRSESKSPAHRRESKSPAPIPNSKSPAHRRASKSPAQSSTCKSPAIGELKNTSDQESKSPSRHGSKSPACRVVKSSQSANVSPLRHQSKSPVRQDSKNSAQCSSKSLSQSALKNPSVSSSKSSNNSVPKSVAVNTPKSSGPNTSKTSSSNRTKTPVSSVLKSSSSNTSKNDSTVSKESSVLDSSGSSVSKNDGKTADSKISSKSGASGVHKSSTQSASKNSGVSVSKSSSSTAKNSPGASKTSTSDITKSSQGASKSATQSTPKSLQNASKDPANTTKHSASLTKCSSKTTQNDLRSSSDIVSKNADHHISNVPSVNVSKSSSASSSKDVVSESSKNSPQCVPKTSDVKIVDGSLSNTVEDSTACSSRTTSINFSNPHTASNSAPTDILVKDDKNITDLVCSKNEGNDQKSEERLNRNDQSSGSNTNSIKVSIEKDRLGKGSNFTTSAKEQGNEKYVADKDECGGLEIINSKNDIEENIRISQQTILQSVCIAQSSTTELQTSLTADASLTCDSVSSPLPFLTSHSECAPCLSIDKVSDGLTSRPLFVPNLVPSRSRHLSETVTPNNSNKHGLDVSDKSVESPSKRAKRSRSASVNADGQESGSRRKSFSGSGAPNNTPGKSFGEIINHQLKNINLKDMVNKPHFNRKAELVMQHLMKEHNQSINRQLRMLAEARMLNKQAPSAVDDSCASLNLQDPLEIDPDLAVDLAALPAEFIENLQNLLDLDVGGQDCNAGTSAGDISGTSVMDSALQNGDVSDMFSSSILGEIVEPESLLIMDQVQKCMDQSGQSDLDDLSASKINEMNLQGNLEYVERKIESLKQEIKSFEESDAGIRNGDKLSTQIDVKEEMFMSDIPEHMEFIGDTENEGETQDTKDLIKELTEGQKDGSMFLSTNACESLARGNCLESATDTLAAAATNISESATNNANDEMPCDVNAAEELMENNYLGTRPDIPDDAAADICDDMLASSIADSSNFPDQTAACNIDEDFAVYDINGDIVTEEEVAGYVVENGVLDGQTPDMYDVDSLTPGDQGTPYNADDSMPSLEASGVYVGEGQLEGYSVDSSVVAPTLDKAICDGDEMDVQESSTVFEVKSDVFNPTVPSAGTNAKGKENIVPFPDESVPVHESVSAYNVDLQKQPMSFSGSVSSFTQSPTFEINKQLASKQDDSFSALVTNEQNKLPLVAESAVVEEHANADANSAVRVKTESKREETEGSYQWRNEPVGVQIDSGEGCSDSRRGEITPTLSSPQAAGVDSARNAETSCVQTNGELLYDIGSSSRSSLVGLERAPPDPPQAPEKELDLEKTQESSFSQQDSGFVQPSPQDSSYQQESPKHTFVTQSSQDSRFVGQALQDRFGGQSPQDTRCVGQSPQDTRFVGKSPQDNRFVAQNSQDNRIVGQTIQDSNVVGHSPRDRYQGTLAAEGHGLDSPRQTMQLTPHNALQTLISPSSTPVPSPAPASISVPTPVPSFPPERRSLDACTQTAMSPPPPPPPPPLPPPPPPLPRTQEDAANPTLQAILRLLQQYRHSEPEGAGLPLHGLETLLQNEAVTVLSPCPSLSPSASASPHLARPCARSGRPRSRLRRPATARSRRSSPPDDAGSGPGAGRDWPSSHSVPRRRRNSSGSDSAGDGPEAARDASWPGDVRGPLRRQRARRAARPHSHLPSPDADDSADDASAPRLGDDLVDCVANFDASETFREMLRVDKEMQWLLAYKMKLYKRLCRGRGGGASERSNGSRADAQVSSCSRPGEGEGAGLDDAGGMLCDLGALMQGMAAAADDGGPAPVSTGSPPGPYGGRGAARPPAPPSDPVCPSPQTTTLTPARESFSGSPSSVSPRAGGFRTPGEVSVEAEGAAPPMRPPAPGTALAPGLGLRSDLEPGASPAGHASKSPDCSDAVTQKAAPPHRDVLMPVPSPPMVRFPSDYCLTVCSTSNLHEAAPGQATLESMLGLGDCQDEGGDGGGAHGPRPRSPRVGAMHGERRGAASAAYDASVVEDVINSALKEQSEIREIRDDTAHLLADVELAAARSRVMDKLEDPLRLTDTSVVEAVLNTFALPDCNAAPAMGLDSQRTPPSETKAEPDSTGGGCDVVAVRASETAGGRDADEDGGADDNGAPDHDAPKLAPRGYARRSYRRAGPYVPTTRRARPVQLPAQKRDDADAEEDPAARGGLAGRRRPRRGARATARIRAVGAARRGGHELRGEDAPPELVPAALSGSGEDAHDAPPDSTRLSPSGGGADADVDADAGAGEARDRTPPARARRRRALVHSPVPAPAPASPSPALHPPPHLQEQAAPPVLEKVPPAGRGRGKRRRAAAAAPPPSPPPPPPAPVLGLETAAAPSLPLEGVEPPFSPGIRTRRRAREASSLEQSDASELSDSAAAPPALVSALPPSLPAPPSSMAVSGRRISRKRKMDYAEIIEPLDKYDHRMDAAPPVLKAERPKGDVPSKVSKVDRTGRLERLDKTEGLRHDRTEKEKPERSATKAERKRTVGIERDSTALAATLGGALASEADDAHEHPMSPGCSSSEGSSDRPLASRLGKSQPATVETDRVRSPSPESGGGDASQDGGPCPRVRTIKDCYIVIKPLDVSQYLCNGRLIDGDGTDAGPDWSTSGAPALAPPPPPPQPAADPTQEIESQLALLEEMSNHLTSQRGAGAGAADADEAPAGGAPSASPAALSLHDEASVSTVASDGAPAAPGDVDHPHAHAHAPSTFGGKRARLDGPASASTCAAGGAAAEDCDKDSVSSSDVAQEGGDCPGKATKRKPRKRKRKNEGSEQIAFEAHRGPILDVKTVGRHVLAACEDGSVYCYSLKSGKLKRQYSGHNAAVICLTILEREGPDGEDPVPEFLYTGSLDRQLRCFQFKTGALVNQPVNLGKPIQCMDENWGTIFMGTKVGEIAKFYTKSFKLNEDYLRCSKESILAVKATKEGARKIIIVAARNEPVTIRDANSGLLMRVIGHNLPHTVYSLLLESSLLYCGTKTGKIPVFSFTTGEEVGKYNAGFGVVCMRVYNHLLFAGCYDGNIYIYSTQDQSFISCIPGPGKMLLCLDVVKNRIIAGSKDSKLQAWPLPADVKSCIRESRHR